MIQLRNNAQSMLAYPVDSATTTLQVIPEDMARFPNLPVPGDHFYCAVADSQGNLEFVRVTGTDTDSATLTVERGKEGTSPRNWNTGDRVQLRMSMATWTDMAGDWWQRVKTAEGNGLAPTLSSSTSFSLSGDWTGEMQEGRKLRVIASDGTVFRGHVLSVAFASETTTVTMGGEPAPTLAGTLVAVDMGFSTELESHRTKSWADEARASKEAAAASEGKAKFSEQAAKLSETNAKASETAATASERAAKASETAAGNSASSALASKNAAAASETSALSAATRAETAAVHAETIAGGDFAPKVHTHTKSQISDLGNATNAAVGLVRGDGVTTTVAEGVLSVIASSAATANSIVKRDASGNIVGNITGHATWADLAEVYKSDMPLEEGDLVCVSPAEGSDVTRAAADSPVLGIVSLRPGVLLNCGAKDEPLHYAVARVGMVPVRVRGPVAKGQRLRPGGDGTARASEDGSGFAFANETKRDDVERLVMCIL